MKIIIIFLTRPPIPVDVNLNILLGKCSSNSREKPYLIALVNIEKTNAVTVNSEIIAKLTMFLIMTLLN